MIPDNFIISIAAEFKWLEKLVEYRVRAFHNPNLGEGQIKAVLTPQDKSEITDFIREYSTKLGQTEEQLIHAKVNLETIEQRSEG